MKKYTKKHRKILEMKNGAILFEWGIVCHMIACSKMRRMMDTYSNGKSPGLHV